MGTRGGSLEKKADQDDEDIERNELMELREVRYTFLKFYGLLTYMYHKFRPNVGKHTIHWASVYSTLKMDC